MSLIIQHQLYKDSYNEQDHLPQRQPLRRAKSVGRVRHTGGMEDH